MKFLKLGWQQFRFRFSMIDGTGSCTNKKVSLTKWCSLDKNISLWKICLRVEDLLVISFKENVKLGWQ